MKQLRSSSDLAIFGAPPAFTQPLHVGRPNMGSKKAFLRYVDDIFDRKWLTNHGPLVEELEQRIAAMMEVKHCVATASGTVALEIATRALDMKDEVIVPSYTFIATAHALQWQGITPVFADIDPVTHHIDPEAVRRMITPRTTGIIGVHIWGRAAPIEDLQAIADEFNLSLMFDAAHAFGCSHDGRMIGGFGRCEVLSFHATKIFNTFEGGAILTNDDDLAAKIRLMKNFGFAGHDNVIYAGTNGKMTEVQAAMGLVNLDAIGHFASINRTNHERYSELLNAIDGLSVLQYDKCEKNNYHYVVVEIGQDFPIDRDDIVSILHSENVLARKYFWPGCHNMLPYRLLYPHAGLLLAKTNHVADRVLVLPTGMSVGMDEIEAIAGILSLLARAPVNVGKRDCDGRKE